MAKPPAPLQVILETDPALADVAFIERGLFAFEEGRLGPPQHTHFSIFLRDSDGRLFGGVDLHVMWQRLFVKTLFVVETLRGQGWGTRLMAATEVEAARRGCRSVWLTALGEPARHFYVRLGYSTFGVMTDYVGGQALYSMEKPILIPKPVASATA